MARTSVLSVFLLVALQHCCVGTGLTVRKPEVEATACVTDDAYTEEVPRYVVDLDLPPGERYAKLVAENRKELQDLSDHVRGLFSAFLYRIITSLVGLVERRLDAEYVEEMKGIAAQSGLDYKEVVLFNIFYEVFTACTSILAVDDHGKLTHARNLDFGLFLGWDKENTTWKLPRLLRKVAVAVEYRRQGKVVAEATTFVGYVGVLTGHRTKAFSVTINERFTLDGGQIGILEWLLRMSEGKWIGFLVRETIHKSQSYDEALKVFTESKLLAPAYIILGSNDTRGCVITRSKSKVVDLWNIDLTKDVWFVLQTNYDRTGTPPFFDNRVAPGNECMTRMGRGNLSNHNLFNVLRTMPLRNKLTVYTTLMTPSEGTMKTYLQDCPSPCPIW